MGASFIYGGGGGGGGGGGANRGPLELALAESEGTSELINLPAMCTGPKMRPRPISFNIIAESAGGIIPASSRYRTEYIVQGFEVFLQTRSQSGS